MPPHDPTLWLESDSDLSSEPSGLPNAELGDVDAVVASAVLGRLFQRLRLLNLLKVDGVEQAAEMSRGVGAEISRVMQTQFLLEKRFESLLGERETLMHAANKAPYLENQRRVSETATTLRSTTRELCVNLKESPDLRANLLWAVGLRAELQSLVAETLQTLRDDNSFPGLVRRRVKEQAKDLDKEQVHIRETNVSREVDLLKKHIRAEQEAYDAWEANKTKIVDEMKHDLKTKKTKTGVETVFAKKDVVANSECGARTRAQALSSLRRETEVLLGEVLRETNAHRTIATFLDKKDADLLKRCVVVEAKHATDAEKRARQLSETNARLEVLEERLPSVTGAYEKELGLQKIRQAEKQKASAKAEKDASGGAEKRARAASRMQFLHKAYQTDRDEKVAQQELAKAEAEAAKGDGIKGGGKGKGKK